MVTDWFVGFVDVPVKLACVSPAVMPARTKVIMRTNAIARRRSAGNALRFIVMSGHPRPALGGEPREVRVPRVVRVDRYEDGPAELAELDRSADRTLLLLLEHEHAGAGEEGDRGDEREREAPVGLHRARDRPGDRESEANDADLTGEELVLGVGDDVRVALRLEHGTGRAAADPDDPAGRGLAGLLEGDGVADLDLRLGDRLD